MVRGPASPKKGGGRGGGRKIRSGWGPKVPKIAAARAHTCQNSPFPRLSHRCFTKTFDQTAYTLGTMHKEEKEGKKKKRRKEEEKKEKEGKGGIVT